MEIIHLICVLNVTFYLKFCIFKPGIRCWRQWHRIICDRSMYLSLTTNRILLHLILILPLLYKVMVLLWKRTQQRCFVMAKRITVLTPTIPCSEQSPQHEQVAHAQLPGLISLDMPASLQTSEEISVKRQPVAHAHIHHRFPWNVQSKCWESKNGKRDTAVVWIWSSICSSPIPA